MEKIKTSNSAERLAYVPASVKTIEIAPHKVICVSTGSSTVTNPFGGVEEEW